MSKNTYTIVVVANEWNRYGAVINRRDVSGVVGVDAADGGKAYASQDTSLWGAQHARHTEVRDDSGRVVEPIELYAEVIGAELFAAQLADESFSINLDDFFRGL